MTGAYLRNKLKEIDISFREIANKMQISEQNLQNKFKTQDIKVSFLVELCKCLNVDIFFFIEGTCPEQIVYESPLLYNSQEEQRPKLAEYEQKREISMLERSLIEKDKLIASLETSLGVYKEIIELQRAMLKTQNSEDELQEMS